MTTGLPRRLVPRQALSCFAASTNQGDNGPETRINRHGGLPDQCPDLPRLGFTADAHLQGVRPAKPDLGGAAQSAMLLLATAPACPQACCRIHHADPGGEVTDGGGQPAVVEHPAVRRSPGHHYLGRYARRLQARRRL